MKTRFNKILSVLLVLIMLVSAVPFSVYANENATKLMGDVNLDKHINSSDVLLILKYSANASDELICDFNQADINGDLKINSIDAFYVLEYAAGLIDDLSNSTIHLTALISESKILSSSIIYLSTLSIKSEYSGNSLCNSSISSLSS